MTNFCSSAEESGTHSAEDQATSCSLQWETSWNPLHGTFRSDPWSGLHWVNEIKDDGSE